MALIKRSYVGVLEFVHPQEPPFQVGERIDMSDAQEGHGKITGSKREWQSR